MFRRRLTVTTFGGIYLLIELVLVLDSVSDSVGVISVFRVHVYLIS